MKSVENKIIRNWRVDEKVFGNLQSKDVVGKNEVVFEVYDLARRFVTTIKETGEDKLEISEYCWKDNGIVRNKSWERVNPETMPSQFYYPEKDFDKVEYDELKSILREALAK